MKGYNLPAANLDAAVAKAVLMAAALRSRLATFGDVDIRRLVTLVNDIQGAFDHPFTMATPRVEGRIDLLTTELGALIEDLHRARGRRRSTPERTGGSSAPAAGRQARRARTA